MASDAWKTWERTVAAGFSNWLTDGKCRDLICRQSFMGRQVESVFGDLALNPKAPEKWRPLGEWFMKRFMIDAKNRKAFSLAGLLTAPNHPFWEWWNKLADDAARSGGKIPLMVLLDKASRAHVLAFKANSFTAYCGEPNFPVLSCDSRALSDGGFREGIWFCKFESFLKWAIPTTFECPEVNKTSEVNRGKVAARTS